MANSIITVLGDGVTTQYPLNFTLGILSRDYVTCRVGSEVDGLGAPVYRTLEWVTDGLVNIQGAVPGNNVPIVFKRTVPKDELQHDYSDGVPITEENLDESNLQTMMAIHEFLDGRLEGGFVQDLNMNGFKITNLGEGTDPDDAVTRSQLEDFTGNAPAYAAAAAASAAAALVSENAAEAAEAQTLIYRDDSANNAAIAQAAVNGLAWKAPVRAATTANITLSAPQTIDGISVIAGDRVLVKNQSTQAQNGIYVVAAGAWTRASDANTWAELVSAAVVVQEGSTQADLEYRCTVNAGGTLESTAVVWANPTATPAANSIVPSQINSGTYASQAEAEAGVENTKVTTSLRVRQAINILMGSVAQMVSGAAGLLVGTANFKTYVETYQPRKVYSANISAGADIQLTSIFRAGYNYRIEIDNLTFSTSAFLYAQFSVDNGATWLNNSSAYTWTGSRGQSSLTTLASGSSGFIGLTGDNVAAADGLSSTIYLFNPAGTAKKTAVRAHTHCLATGQAYHTMCYAKYILANISPNAFRIYPSSGTFLATGTITVWEEPI